jgi:hypothetical protein
VLRPSLDEALEFVREADGLPVLVYFDPPVSNLAWKLRFEGLTERVGGREVVPLYGAWSPTAGLWLDVTEDTLRRVLQNKRLLKAEVCDEA